MNRIARIEERPDKNGVVRHTAIHEDGTTKRSSKEKFLAWQGKINKEAAKKKSGSKQKSNVTSEKKKSTSKTNKASTSKEPAVTRGNPMAARKSSVSEEQKFDVKDKDLGEMLDGFGAWLYPTSEPSPYWPDEGGPSGGQILVSDSGALKFHSSNERTQKEGRQFETGRQLAEGLPDLVVKLAGEFGISPQQIAQHLCEKLLLAVAQRAGVDVKPKKAAYRPPVSFRHPSSGGARAPVVTEPAGIIPSQQNPPSWVTMMSQAYDAYKVTHPDEDDDTAVENELEAR
ncbi:MAG: hypothetical protein GY822_08810 [Deltaproteobacteria bacterium]|nr:hypothetical protein [Deltaproteobacteria bacterium]